MAPSPTVEYVRGAVEATLGQPSARVTRGASSDGEVITPARVTSTGRCAFSVDAALVSQRFVDDAAGAKWNSAARADQRVGERLVARAVAGLAEWQDFLYAGGAALRRVSGSEWQDTEWGRREGPRPAANPMWMLYALAGVGDAVVAADAVIGETVTRHVIASVDPALARPVVQLPRPWGRPGRLWRRSGKRLRVDLWIDPERRVRRISALVIEDGPGVWDTVQFDDFGVNVSDIIELVDDLPPCG